MTLAELVRNFPQARIQGDENVSVEGISLHSGNTKPGDLFVALTGAHTHGLKYVEEAKQKGATAVIVEEIGSVSSSPAVILPEVRKHLGTISARIYGEPALRLRVIGITGTNGKTTVATLVQAAISACSRKCGYIGTLHAHWGEKSATTLHTTPEAPELHQLLRDMVRDNVSDVVMECSSHGIEMGRVGALDLDVAVFTNLTAEHLDFHGSMERYRDAKFKLFSECLSHSRKEKRVAVLNLDDPWGVAWAKSLEVPMVTFATGNSGADINVTESKLLADGIQAKVSVDGQSLSIGSSLVGAHNLSNLVATLAICRALELPLDQVVHALAEVPGVPGRLEPIRNPYRRHVFVDYAHTEDALRNVLQTLLPFRTRRLIVVFGCGGDRDATKRPRMAQVVSEMADVSMITSDNPRSENPETILDQMMEGVSSDRESVSYESLTSSSTNVVTRIADRKRAIERSLEISEEGDIILVAGKGHETYQEIKGVRYPFDDRQVARDWLARRVS